MAISHQRLDKFIGQCLSINKRAVKLLLAQSTVIVDGEIVTDGSTIIHRFSHIVVDNHELQNEIPIYIMLHKPVGVVCATKDKQHNTVIDLLSPYYDSSICESLHIVGRLDLNTSGLVLLTNDSRWSNKITSPKHKVEKKYKVTLQNDLSDDYITAFEQGMYFAYENITTQPANLTIIDNKNALVSLTEGRYHQIKRMFGRFRNPVVALHRLSIGNLVLDTNLNVGFSKRLTNKEALAIFNV